MPYRTIVGPEAMIVERNGVRSAVRALSEADDTASIKTHASELAESIRPFLAWAAWFLHRVRMAQQRRLTAQVRANWPGPYFAGPRPDLVATKPWRIAQTGEWSSLPPRVVARLIRQPASPQSEETPCP